MKGERKTQPEMTSREADEALGINDTMKLGRRFRRPDIALWRAWTGRELGQTEGFEAGKQLEVLEAAYSELARKAVILCECGEPASHALRRFGFKGDQDYIQFVCRQHIPESHWTWGDLLPFADYEEEDSG